MNKLTTLIVSDTHIGHDCGLKSDTALHKGKIDTQNRWQEPIYDHWKELCKKYKNPDCLILNGDIVDLLQKRSDESEVWTQDTVEIKKEAAKLIRMLGTPKKTYFIKGTPAHVTAEHIRLEEDLANELKTEIYQNKRVYPYRLIDLAPKGAQPQIYHITHHLSSTGMWQNRGTAPSMAMATLMLNESSFIKKTDLNKISGIIRSHLHHFWYEESASRRMIVNPCWEAQTNWMIQKMPENRPEIGSVILTHYLDGEFDMKKFILPNENQRPPVFRAAFDED